MKQVDVDRLIAQVEQGAEGGWTAQVNQALAEAVVWMRRAFADGGADPSEPKAVRAVALAMVALADVALTWKLYHARLDRQARRQIQPDRSVSAGPTFRAAS